MDRREGIVVLLPVEVSLVRHDKIATGRRELPLLRLVAGLATNIICSFGVLRRDASTAP
jgi:hypothetical protein